MKTTGISGLFFTAVAAATMTCAAALLASSNANAANQISLSGAIAQSCSINVTADGNASALNLAASGAQRVQVGTIAQSCNKKAGYTIAVTSTNCAAGAKVIGSVSGDSLAYSVEANNPTTGGSTAVVTGLLAAVCTGQNARTVTNAKIPSEDSTVFVNYTGSTGLAADTYQDTLTFTMTVN